MRLKNSNQYPNKKNRMTPITEQLADELLKIKNDAMFAFPVLVICEEAHCEEEMLELLRITHFEDDQDFWKSVFGFLIVKDDSNTREVDEEE